VRQTYIPRGVKAGARLFGNITALHLVVEAGAVFVGTARIGKFA
jgi:cytoskeletal protein CcmA (bactofilin family)